MFINIYFHPEIVTVSKVTRALELYDIDYNIKPSYSKNPIGNYLLISGGDKYGIDDAVILSINIGNRDAHDFVDWIYGLL